MGCFGRAADFLSPYKDAVHVPFILSLDIRCKHKVEFLILSIVVGEMGMSPDA